MGLAADSGEGRNIGNGESSQFLEQVNFRSSARSLRRVLSRPMEAYSMDLRERVIAACDRGQRTKDVAKTFGVSPSGSGGSSSTAGSAATSFPARAAGRGGARSTAAVWLQVE